MPPDMTAENNTQDIARILSEALPFMQLYDGETVVVKYGGHAMVDPGLSAKFARDMVQLKLSGINPIVVHGGGPQIGSMLVRMNIVWRFEEGLGVTDKDTM
jgi:acetylglutamate kinase